jgi:hypothetical protein
MELEICACCGKPKKPKAPASPLAQAWEGHRYGGQALKPALEPVIVAQVPYSSRPVESITATGAGALWIDGGRLATGDDLTRVHHMSGRYIDSANGSRPPHPREYVVHTSQGKGRWPANFCLQHLPACKPLGVKTVPGTNIPGPSLCGMNYEGVKNPAVYRTNYTNPDGTETVQAYACADGCPVAALDRQAGERSSGARVPSPRQQEDGWGMSGGTSEMSQGSASRFFHVSDWSLDVAEQLAQADPVYYCAKASASERHQGLDQRNDHPTIKPLTLLRWLATLLLPPAPYAPRRLLVPFCGTSSEVISGMLAGFEMVIGIERELTAVEIGRKRIAWWTGHTVPSPTVVDRAQQETTVPIVSGQLNLFGRE